MSGHDVVTARAPDEFPMPVTSNGWSPIEAFDPDAEYADEFLVVLKDDEAAFTSQAWYGKERIEGYPVDDAPRITGIWRATDTMRDMTPVAFMPMPDLPDFDQLKEIVERMGLKPAA